MAKIFCEIVYGCISEAIKAQLDVRPHVSPSFSGAHKNQRRVEVCIVSRFIIPTGIIESAQQAVDGPSLCQQISKMTNFQRFSESLQLSRQYVNWRNWSLSTWDERAQFYRVSGTIGILVIIVYTQSEIL